MAMTVEVPELPELTFDEASHIYRLNGDVIPSVSKLMEPLKDQCYGGISKRTLENAANKGSSVHNSIENWIKFGIDDIPSEHRGYFNGFMEWWKQCKPRVFGSEVRIYHKLMRYGGTIDLLCEIGGLLELIDFKTTYSLLEMTCGVQLEAYSQALISHGITPQRKHILHLKKDGKWAFREFPAKDPARCRVMMTSLVKLLELIQGGEEKESDIIARMNSAKLVIFDDLGAERNTDYALEKIYNIIDSRYRRKLPMLLTTNLTIDEMKDEEDRRYSRIYDRIFETCYSMQFTGPSWRKKEASRRFTEMEKLFDID